MKANPSYLLDSLSNNDVTFYIPPYQRNYEWSMDNCRVLLADVVKVASANSAKRNTEHFFGSIVYVVEEVGFGIPAKYVLTDGQQRITTTMLLLMALRDCIDDTNYKAEIQRRYLENDRADNSVEYKIKLKQVETDWEAYKLLVLGRDVPEGSKNSSVFQNYTFFKKALESVGDSERKSLLEKGLMKFSIIAIQLEPDRNPWENPQEIFESMNSLGKPLSLADLVRNYLLMGKNTSQQSVLYNDYWLALENQLPGKLSEFIRDWMQADQHRSFKVAREANYKELYGAFKEIARERNAEVLFQSFVEFAHPYSVVCGLQESGVKEIDKLISDLNVIGIAPAYSYIAQLLLRWDAGRLSSPDLAAVLTGIRTYLLRRRVLGITQAENKFYPVLGKRLGELADSEDKTATLFAQLSSQEYALRLPNDDEMISRLRTLNFYNLGRSRNYPRLLLCMAEEHLTKSRPSWDDPVLQLEHIMPQKLNEAWRTMLGNDAERVHQEFVNNVGNITLIRHNQELGNKAFSEKIAVYASRSGLQVAQNMILDRKTWDEEAILRRQDFIIDMIVSRLLEVPSSFRRASNWSKDERDAGVFDQRATLNPLIGETIEFIENASITAEVISDTKVQFEGGEWALGPLTKMLKQRGGAHVSRSSNFHGASYWSWDGVKLVDLEI
ncbi:MULTISPECIES: DUF262 domain-containing protein [Nocardiaceae]|uniref:DUF262 domain-containing protein n=1 Tax=Rhodococcoides kroppenstedtii TaxID=293050 RepID=A0ABS7NPM9_9NOCA|nr:MULTISPECIES: DUF262 domain-containing protein [Rhodococcus]AMY18056.1 hypothetical protein A3Q40_00648 [Rhodococcus sp. PBTS 1]MBY6313608.1 DUF262 domain-containing protein [Rhodococcus kroppenstedtii]MBY6319969.1 DUF262 domain-containing protein [Rhodococcus kroppenstedtii]MBY6398908.1 DUF262 domain-containing protein [Rhodococcus kroppenstedtii]